MAFHYLTPAVAKIAYEQIIAHMQEERGANAKIPTKLAPKNHVRFAGILKSAGIEIEMLEKAGVVKVHREEQHNCGMTGYSRTDERYTVDMTKLYEIASQSLPAPQIRVERFISDSFDGVTITPPPKP